MEPDSQGAMFSVSTYSLLSYVITSLATLPKNTLYLHNFCPVLVL